MRTALQIIMAPHHGLPLRNPMLLLVIPLLAILTPTSAHASHADHPELLRLLDFAEYIAAEDSARALYEGALAGSEDEATGVDLFLRAARLSGRAPVQALIGLAAEILVEREAAYGPDDLHVANILHELGNLQLRADDPEAAAITHARALALREATMDSLDFEVASSAQALANAQFRLGNYDNAEALYEKALRGAAHSRPGEPFRAAFAFNGLALIAQREGDLDRAQQLYEQALEASVDPRVEEHPRTATIARNLGRLLLDRGQPYEAIAALETAYRIRTRRLDPRSVHLSNAAFDLARAETELGEIRRAREHVDQALRIRDDKLGLDHAATLVARELRVELSTQLGDFAAAEADLDRLDQLDDQGEQEDQDTRARDRHQFLRANLCNEQGDYSRARVAYEALLAGRRNQWGGDDPRVAATLHNLSEIYRQLGDRPAALRARRQAVEIQSRALAGTDPDLARGLVNLADLLLEEAGRVTEARELLSRSDEIFVRSLGAEHPVRANPLYLLAECDGREGQGARAVVRCRQALDLQRASYGEEHAEVAWGQERLARAEIQAGDLSPGMQDALAAAALEQRQLRWALQGLAERSALRFAAASMGAVDLAVATLLKGDMPSSTTASVYEAVIAGRSLVLEGILARQTEASRVGGGEDPAWDRVNVARGRLAAAISNQSLRSVQLDSLRQEKDRAEAAWARSLGRLPAEENSPKIGALRTALGQNSGLLSFAVYDAELSSRRSEPHYAGFFLRRDGSLQAEDLGLAREVDALVARWREAVLRPTEEGGAERTTALGLRLCKTLLDPFGDALRTVDELNLVLDGALHGLSFAALPVESGPYWVEAGPRLVLLDHERQLVEPPVASAAAVTWLAFGDVDFGKAPAIDAGPCDDLSELRFAPLPATADELDDIARFFPNPRVRRGSEATEAAFRRDIADASVVHVASHGFFLGEGCRESAAGSNRGILTKLGTRGIGGLRKRSPRRVVFERSPLLRAGLVFAGANDRNARTPADNDGILLAEEVLGLRLKPGAWVVLSACDTGVGEAQTGEGVLGLRRAFAVAGARVVLMSLWPVQDESAREWMHELYQARWQARWQDRLSTASAVQRASRRVLQARRSRGESTHPFWWAGFIAAGRD